MTYNIQKIPFSAYGSYFVISVHPKDGALYIRDIHGAMKRLLMYLLLVIGYRFPKAVRKQLVQ